VAALAVLASTPPYTNEGTEMKHSFRDGARGVLWARHWQTGKLAAVAAIMGLVCAAAAQEHVIVNFDDAGLGLGVHAGNIFLADGVRITSCTAPDAISVGATITLTGLQPWFELWQYGWAVSPPNYMVALNAGVTDTLLSFTVPVTSVAMSLDFYPDEAVDTDRLVILQSTGSNTFKVLKFIEFTDEVGVPPAAHVSIDLGGDSFSYVLFQTLTELEGFDDLEFYTTGPIPEPPEEGPPGPAPPGSGGWAGGGGGSGGGGEPEPPTTNENSSGDTNPVVNENKSQESPTTGDQTSGSDDSSGVPAGSDATSGTSDGAAAEVNVNSDTGGTSQNGSSGGGACGAPVAIVMLCGMFLLRSLGRGSAARGKS
jgi:hypothetical protein